MQLRSGTGLATKPWPVLLDHYNKSEFILRFRFSQQYNSAEYLEKIQEFSKRSNMLHIEPSGDNEFLKLTYDINLKEGANADELTKAMGKVDGITEVVLIASKSDIDY